jgi:hypothetical protein
VFVKVEAAFQPLHPRPTQLESRVYFLPVPFEIEIARSVCTACIATDNCAVKLPDPPEKIPSARVPKGTLIIMSVILAVMAFVSIYANVQRWRRDKIETVIVTPAASPSATAQ